MKSNSIQAAQPPLIEIEGASVQLGGQVILSPVNLTIEPGERVAVLGPNGAGKSTLVKLITGELHPFAGKGRVVLGGRIRAGLRNFRNQIVSVSADLESKLIHDPTLHDLVLSGRFGGLGVLQGVTPSADDERAAVHSMEEMGIEALAHRPLSTLSSGEKRRGWIARALATSPLGLVLDEPTANLDFQSRKALHTRLEGLSRGTLAVLLVTHHIEDVIPFFQRILLLEKGEIVFDGGREDGLEFLRSGPKPASNALGAVPRGAGQTQSQAEFPSPEEYLAAMRSAPVYDVAIESPLEEGKLLSQKFGARILLKREDLQPTFSFKIRGSYVKMLNLSASDRKKGVIAASAGNHAQGVALAGQKLGIQTRIVVPVTTPAVKTDAILALGAELELHGDSYDEAYLRAKERAKKEGLVFIHPYDDPNVIAGQGTIGLEIHRQRPERIDAVFVAVGGGGLISGIAIALKQLRPGIKIIGVEPEDASAMHDSLLSGERVTLGKVGQLADGVAVKRVGEETFRIAREFVDEVIVVSNDEICAAIREVFEDRRAVLEPSGALSVAGIKKYMQLGDHENCTYVAITCGANLTFERLQYVAERSLIGERREAILAVKIPEVKGSFCHFCQVLGPKMVTEFNYRMSDPAQAIVFVGIRVEGDGARESIISQLQMQGYETTDLTQDDLAADHLRHMVGGKSPHPKCEQLFHFDFPERSGALLSFLERLGGKWNISLFHYRNHGADRGRVLIGFEVEEESSAEFHRFLDEVNYPWSEVTTNPGLSRFLL